jgi:hypothetical protein
MSFRFGARVVTVAAFAAFSHLLAQPPSPFIDKGACPFEGCVYRTWVANKEIHVVAAPGSSKEVGVVQSGTRVLGLTGEVHSIPLLVHATWNHPDLNAPNRILIPRGSAYYVIHYVGEGVWLCWYKGHQVYVENFSDRGPYPKATWWVKIQLPSGLSGWTISNGNFDGQDSLG